MRAEATSGVATNITMESFYYDEHAHFTAALQLDTRTYYSILHFDGPVFQMIPKPRARLGMLLLIQNPNTRLTVGVMSN